MGRISNFFNKIYNSSWLKSDELDIALNSGDSNAYSTYTKDPKILDAFKKAYENIEEDIKKMNTRAKNTFIKKDMLHNYKEQSDSSSAKGIQTQKQNMKIENEINDKEYDEPTK